MKLKCCHFDVLTFVVQQLLFPDNLSLKDFFSLYTTTRHIEAQESLDFYDLRLTIPSLHNFAIVGTL